MSRIVTQESLKLFVQRLILHMREGRKQKATRTASRVRHCFANLRIHYINNGINKGTRREILPSTTLLILAVLLKNAFIQSALHVAVHQQPRLLVDKGNELLKVDGTFNTVGRLRENRADKAVLTTQNIQRLFVLIEQVFPGFLEQIFPTVAIRHSRSFQEELYALTVHLQKE